MATGHGRRRIACIRGRQRAFHARKIRRSGTAQDQQGRKKQRPEVPRIAVPAPLTTLIQVAGTEPARRRRLAAMPCRASLPASAAAVDRAVLVRDSGPTSIHEADIYAGLKGGRHKPPAPEPAKTQVALISAGICADRVGTVERRLGDQVLRCVSLGPGDPGAARAGRKMAVMAQRKRPRQRVGDRARENWATRNITSMSCAAIYSGQPGPEMASPPYRRGSRDAPAGPPQCHKAAARRRAGATGRIRPSE